MPLYEGSRVRILLVLCTFLLFFFVVVKGKFRINFIVWNVQLYQLREQNTNLAPEVWIGNQTVTLKKEIMEEWDDIKSSR